MTEPVPLAYTQSVGDRLRALRRQRGLSLLDVEEATNREFKASVTGAYERGERVMSILRLQRLAQFYRVPVDQLLPPVEGPGAVAPSSEELIPRRPVTLDWEKLARVDTPEGQVVRRYVNAIQSQRRGPRGPAISIREEDLRVLARFMERDEAAMELRLVQLGLRY